jgi:hypothetical protein
MSDASTALPYTSINIKKFYIRFLKLDKFVYLDLNRFYHSVDINDIMKV